MADVGEQIGGFLARRSAEAHRRSPEDRRAADGLVERALAGTGDGVWEWDLATDELRTSASWKAILGFGPDELGNAPGEWLDRIHPDDLERVRTKLAAHALGGASAFEDECRIRHRDGDYRWLLVRGAVESRFRTPPRISGLATDVTEKNPHDALTGMPGRAMFLERLLLPLARARRKPDELFAVLAVKVADVRLVAAAGNRVQMCLRPGDVVARVGRQLFAVLLDGIGDPADAASAAARLERELSSPLEAGGAGAPASVGIWIGGKTAGDAEGVLRRLRAVGAEAGVAGG